MFIYIMGSLIKVFQRHYPIEQMKGYKNSLQMIEIVVILRYGNVLLIMKDVEMSIFTSGYNVLLKLESLTIGI